MAKPDDYELAIVQGARKYIAEHGRRPAQRSGDSEPYTGMSVSWADIDQALGRGAWGLRKVGGLRKFLDEQRIGEPLVSMPAPLTGRAYKAAVVDGAHKYLELYGRRPSQHSGDATEYVGFPTTWSTIESALYQGRLGCEPGGSLRSLLDEHRVGKALATGPHDQGCDCPICEKQP